MKKNFVLISIILSTIILAVLSILTVIRIQKLGTEPVAPSAPKSKPGAAVNTTLENEINTIWDRIAINPSCKFTIKVLPGPSATPTATGAPCKISINGKVYLDVSDAADYRTSDQETWGPVGFRVDLKEPGATSFDPGGASKFPSAQCSTLGGYGTGDLVKKNGVYAIRIVLNDSNWMITETYLAKNVLTACLNNKDAALSPIGLNSHIVEIPNLSFESCGNKNIWFGVRRKTPATPTPTGTLIPSPTPTITPTPTPTNTPTNTPVPTATNTPVPSNTPVPTNTPVITNTPGPSNTPGPTNTPKPTNTPRPTSTPKTIVEASPTEAQLPQAGIKIPTLGGIFAGFLLIAIGVALVF